METGKKLKRKIESLMKKKDPSLLKNWDDSGFYINNIGPEISKLISMVEGINYYYKTIDYHGVNHYIDHYGIDSVYYNGKCTIITTKDNLSIEEDNNVGDFFDGKDTICLATSGFELPPTFYDGKLYRAPRLEFPNNVLHFYDDSGNKVILFKNFPYVYDFLDLAIKKQAERSVAYLSRMEYNDLINEVVRAELQRRNQENNPNFVYGIDYFEMPIDKDVPFQRKRVNNGEDNSNK